MKLKHARQNYLQALWIYLIALLLLGLTFHSEAKDPSAAKGAAKSSALARF
jgi:hypothetical protein